MELVVHPLTPANWSALEDLFGKGGASNGCWCMYWRIGPAYHRGPRAQNRGALRALAPVDDLPVWSVSCFYVRRGYRRKGVMSALIVAALKAAKRGGAPALEAYPVDTACAGATRNVFTGTAAAFRRAGFAEVACRAPSRPLMRHDLDGVET